MLKDSKITILGAGLVGSLLSIFLRKKGFNVEILEQRPDMRVSDIVAGRSINLVLTKRGLDALDKVNLLDKVKELYIPLKGRMLHDLEGNEKFQSYGQKEDEVIYSVSRGMLNCLLMDEAESLGVKIYFNEKSTGIDLEEKTISLADGNCRKYDVLFAADGGGSIVRKSISEYYQSAVEEEFLDHDYKELYIPASRDGDFLLESNALHIWPRKRFMLIALPNIDGSFTVTLFMPKKGTSSFEILNESQNINIFFKEQFPDAYKIMPDLEKLYYSNPEGYLATVKADKWHHKDSVLLVGDAAHAIVPFQGQGMNCGFEDCNVLNDCIEKYENWQVIFETFFRERKDNCDAIADMALDNYVEMRDTSSTDKFNLKKELGFRLEREFPGVFIPKYSMIMFKNTPYSLAQKFGMIQDYILNKCVDGISDIEQLDMELAKKLVEEELVEQI